MHVFSNASVASSWSPAGRLTARSLFATLAAAALFGGVAGTASAAPGDTSRDTVTANVGVTSAILLSGLTSSFTLNGLPGATVTGAAAVTFNVQTNNIAGYSVTVQSEDAALTPQTPGNTDEIPISNLKVRESGSGAFTALSDTNPVTVHTQAQRSGASGDSLSNDYQVDIPFVADDTYSATLDYVATAL